MDPDTGSVVWDNDPTWGSCEREENADQFLSQEEKSENLYQDSSVIRHRISSPEEQLAQTDQQVLEAALKMSREENRMFEEETVYVEPKTNIKSMPLFQATNNPDVLNIIEWGLLRDIQREFTKAATKYTELRDKPTGVISKEERIITIVALIEAKT